MTWTKTQCWKFQQKIQKTWSNLRCVFELPKNKQPPCFLLYNVHLSPWMINWFSMGSTKRAEYTFSQDTAAPMHNMDDCYHYTKTVLRMPTLMVCRHTGNPLHIKQKPLFSWSKRRGRASKSINFMLMFFLLLQVTKSCSQIPKISCERCVGGHFKDWKRQDEGWSMLYNCTFFCFPTCAIFFKQKCTTTATACPTTLPNKKNIYFDTKKW